jgi:hypothetical protein
MAKKRIKEKIEYFCPNCKRFVNFNETKGEIGGLSGMFIGGFLRRQEYPKTSRYHLKCGQQLVELSKKRSAKK